MIEYCYVLTDETDGVKTYKDALSNGTDITATDDADFTTKFKVISGG